MEAEEERERIREAGTERGGSTMLWREEILHLRSTTASRVYVQRTSLKRTQIRKDKEKRDQHQWRNRGEGRKACRKGWKCLRRGFVGAEGDTHTDDILVGIFIRCYVAVFSKSCVCR